MSCPASSRGAIPIAISSLVVRNAIRRRGSAAADFLRWLYRERRLTAAELTGRLRALDALVRGKLRPCFTNDAGPLPREGRPPLDPAKR